MAATSTPPPWADAVYLRRLLERLPTCLIRVRLDGVLLACNDAGLGLFGVRKLAAILNTNLADRIVTAELTKWQEFTKRLWATGAASVETLLVVDDDIRPVLVQGIALNNDPDGVDSLLLNLRDQSQMHRLEHSIRSAEINRAGQEERQRASRDQVEQAVVERMQLAAIAAQHQAEHEGERHRLTEALDAQIAERQRREAISVDLEGRVEQSQLALLAKGREHHSRIAALEATLAAVHAAHAFSARERDMQSSQREQKEAASSERHRQQVAELRLRLQISASDVARLGALAAEHEGQRKQMAAEQHAAVAALEQALARAREEVALGRDEAREVVAVLRAQLSASSAEQRRLAARVEDLERERDRMSAEHHQALADLEISKRDLLGGLRAQMAQATAEHTGLAARVEEHARERDRMIAGHHQAVADLETSKREALAGLRAQLAQTTAEHGGLAARVDELERERDRMSAGHHRVVADLQTGQREELSQLRAQLAQTTAERTGLIARVEEHERERDRMSAEHRQAVADLETGKREALAGLHAQLAQTTAEHTGLAASVEEHARERDRMRAEHHQGFADLETRKREALAVLRAQLAQASSHQSDLFARIEEHEREHERTTAEHQRAMADLRTSKREVLVECERVLTEVQQELLVRDEASAEIERRIVKVIEEAVRQKAGGAGIPGLERPPLETIEQGAAEEAHREHTTDLQGGLTHVVSETQEVLTGVEPLHEAFDAADVSFVRQLIGFDEPSPKAPDPDLEEPVFDAEDDAFVRRLIEGTHVAADDEPLQDLLETPPSPVEDS